MRLKLLLLFVGISGILGAQKYDSLVITELRGIDDESSTNVYIELTNMGNTPVDLLEFQFYITGRQNDPIDPAVDTVFDAFNSGVNERSFELWPGAAENLLLQPGKTFVMALAQDFIWNMQKLRVPGYDGRPSNPAVYPYADFLAHLEEKDILELEKYPEVRDSTTWGPDSLYWHEQYGSNVTRTLNSMGSSDKCFVLTHKWNETDSCTTDQVRGIFDDDGSNSDGPWQIAGIEDASHTCILYRKFSIKKGERNFNLRGAGSLGLSDSDWIPIRWPAGADNWRDVWWTVGNHGDYMLDENTLEPKAGTGVTVDFSGKTITVPWGTRRLDDIMRKMERKPGVAWIYEVNGSSEDSLLRSAQTGDRLAINVVGSTLYTDTFNIVVSDPLESDNIVIPVDHMSEEVGPITDNVQNGKLGWPRVTAHGENDTITGAGYGLPSGLRLDSLFKYLEKAPDASWEIVFVDGNVRADLRNGDKLKVTAKDQSVKEYLLEVQAFEPSYNAFLSSITWPDISLSAIEKIIYDWSGDTIPNFGPNTTGYRVFLPADHEGIPALVAKTQSPNATLSIKRATTFDGSVDDRTTLITVTSEAGDTVQRVYQIEFVKEIKNEDLPENHMLPLMAQTCRAIQSSHYIEILNPGNRVMDLSRYLMTGFDGIDPILALTQNSAEDDWMSRYSRYVPGRKWVDSTTWRQTPSILIEDLGVNATILPGDVFLMGEIFDDKHVLESSGYTADGDWPLAKPGVLDVQFRNEFSDWQDPLDTIPFYQNPWGEPTGSKQTPFQNTFNKDWFMFRILNDSVRDGTKEVIDPNDFEVIEYAGVEDGRWYAAGIRQTQRHVLIRKAEIIEPNPFIPSDAPEGSFGDNAEESEWHVRNAEYYSARNLPGSTEFNLESELGVHFFNSPTFYIPTVKAVIYDVSKGFTNSETITGVLNGTTVEMFLGNLYPADTGQDLSVISGTTGLELGADDVLSTNDTLLVLAADSAYTSQLLDEKTLYSAKYIITTGDEGLSSEAALTSTAYTVTTADTTGTIAGMEYTTTIQDVIDNVTVPPGAILTVLDENGLYVPLKRLNNGGEYYDATANTNVYFEVVAQNTVTTILYQLQPTAPEGEVFVTSDKYDVSMDDLLIKFIPAGTKYESFLSNVIPSPGASLKLIDKTGFERTDGFITQDDRLVVTSADEALTVTYFLALMDDEMVETTISLAYITSTVYGIDQVAWIVTVSEIGTSVTDFLANVTPATGATAIVIDGSGNDKVSGNIANTDMVKVTSANGEITVLYTLDVYTGIQPSHFSNVQLYPNPTNAKIYISGLEQGSRIQIYNSLGAKVVDVYSMDQGHTISLEREDAGLYLIVVSVNDVPVGRYKAIKK